MLPPLPSFFPESLHQVPPAQARLCLSVAKFVQSHLQLPLRHTRILVALSGGTDSLALLLILYFLRAKYKLNLQAVHFDHALRKHSAAEADWCARFCRSINIPFYTERNTLDSKRNVPQSAVEETARDLRYAFYAKARMLLQADWVAQGHQLNDLAEDVLMRLTRGVGWPALAGMQGICSSRGLFRPLLLISRRQLQNFLDALGIASLQDPSNFDSHFFRNRVRLHFVPLFERENPQFLQNIANLWKMGQWDKDYFDSQIQTLMHLSSQGLNGEHKAAPIERRPRSEQSTLDKRREIPFALMSKTSVLHKCHKAIRLRFYRKQLNDMGIYASATSLFSLDRCIEGKQFPKKILFPRGGHLLVKKKVIFWGKIYSPRSMK